MTLEIGQAGITAIRNAEQTSFSRYCFVLMLSRPVLCCWFVRSPSMGPKCGCKLVYKLLETND